jgi:nucleotide-binding universal stress UspA family protein
MDHTRSIVVGTDFSDDARSAFERALRLARDSGAHVVLVHAYEETLGGDTIVDPTPELMERLDEAIAASSAAKHGVHVEPLVRRGPPWDKLLNVATEHGAEFIVVGKSGERGYALGSVTTRVLTLSKRCVLVVPSKSRTG